MRRSGARSLAAALLLALLLLPAACGRQAGRTEDGSAAGETEGLRQETAPPETRQQGTEASGTEETGGQTASEEGSEMRISLRIGDSRFTAVLEENAAAEALAELVRQGDVTVRLRDYGGFEKVGDLGTSLPASDSQTTARPGDFVLYQGDQIVLFYGSNSWNYTRLGHVEELDGWEEALGSGDVTVIFQAAEGV